MRFFVIKNLLPFSTTVLQNKETKCFRCHCYANLLCSIDLHLRCNALVMPNILSVIVLSSCYWQKTVEIPEKQSLVDRVCWQFKLSRRHFEHTKDILNRRDILVFVPPLCSINSQEKAASTKVLCKFMQDLCQRQYIYCVPCARFLPSD